MNSNATLYSMLSTLTQKNSVKDYESNQANSLTSDEEYKVLVKKWIDSVLDSLESKLIEAAQMGKKEYSVRSKLFKNPGILPNGKHCNQEWVFNKYLTSLIDPKKAFQEKVGDGITIQSSSEDYIHCGASKYPSVPQDTWFSYTFTW